MSTRRKIAKVIHENPKIDKAALMESIQLVSALRKMGSERKGFTILSPSESILRIKQITPTQI